MTFEMQPICDICKKPRGRFIKHNECSKIRESYPKKLKSKKPSVLTEKRIDSFLKSLGE